MKESSFYNLYSLGDASKIWKVEESVLRKSIYSGRLSVDNDVKKFGKQWVVKKEAMDREYGIMSSGSSDYAPDENKRKQIYYFISECLIGYSRRIKKSVQESAVLFSRFNIWNYLYECYDYIHLDSINHVISDISSRIRRGVVYA